MVFHFYDAVVLLVVVVVDVVIGCLCLWLPKQPDYVTQLLMISKKIHGKGKKIDSQNVETADQTFEAANFAAQSLPSFSFGARF